MQEREREREKNLRVAEPLEEKSHLRQRKTCRRPQYQPQLG
jgi:hypothetical protein